MVLCTDVATLPEIIPGASEFVDAVEGGVLSIDSLIGYLKKEQKPNLTTFAIIPLVILLAIVPALFYRWSLKSTAIIWSPLLWVFRPIRGADNPAHFAKGILTLSYYKISRVYSLIVVALFGGKFLLWLQIVKATDALVSFVGEAQFSRIVVPNSIITWHLAAVINALLTWIIFFKAEFILHETRDGQIPSPRSARQFFVFTFVLRNALSVYVSVCALYIAVSIASRWTVPPLEIILVLCSTKRQNHTVTVSKSAGSTISSSSQSSE